MNFFVPFDNQEMGCKDVKYPLFYGEGGATGTIPALRKTRPIEDKTSVIFNIGTLRHTLPCETVRKVDIPWSEKSHNVVWRGATTGGQLRVNLVENYGNKYDIGFASVKQKPELAHLKKNKISIQDQLKYKFIISIAGNELASNLRWTLFSNSVPIMPTPKWHSWIMEKNLKPNVHYLELNPDLTNLEEILDWAINNDEECNQIAQNGKKYMEQFLDPKKDLPVQKRLLEEYAKRLTYTNN